jgi:hypothetical protein
VKFCGEIIYETKDGNVHSDICFNCNPSNDSRALTVDYRKFIHACLDEWLNQSNGTGAFWVGNPDYFNSWEKQ